MVNLWLGKRVRINLYLFPKQECLIFIKLLVKLDELELIYKIDAINYQTIKSQELLDHIDRVGVSLLQTTTS